MRGGGILDWLTRTPVIWGFFIATLLVGFSFYFVQQAAGGGALLDQIASGDAAAIRLAEMTADQKRAHFLGTAGLDTLYPITYFGFIAGLSARLAGTWRIWVILPVGFTAVVDYIENTVQAMALAGRPPEILLVKDIVTPMKFAGFSIAILLMLTLVIVALVKRGLAPREEKND